MVEQTVPLELFIQIFMFGALAIFLAFAAATFVLIVHLTSLPERRRPPRQQADSAASFAD